MNVEKLKAMGAGTSRIGGGMRRKKKAVHKTASTDDKRLQNTLKRLGVNTIPGIEEVDIYQGDTIIHFVNPKVQASIAANTYVVSGPSQTKNVSEMMPAGLQQMLAQMGGMGGMTPENMANLQKLMAQMGQGEGAAGGDDDDEVPELVENFEEVAQTTA